MSLAKIGPDQKSLKNSGGRPKSLSDCLLNAGSEDSFVIARSSRKVLKTDPPLAHEEVFHLFSYNDGAT